MLDREVHIKVLPPFRMISEYRSRHRIEEEVSATGGAGKEKDTLRPIEDVLLCRGLLYEVRTHFEGGNGYPF